jgi:folate-binding protein YgfZ
MRTPDSVAAVRHVRATFGVGWLQDVAVLQVTGPDAFQFLQNRLSNDVLALKPGQGQLNAVLDRQAKIQGVFGLYREENGFRILIDRAEQDNAVAQILKFRILEQVQIEDISTSVATFSAQGPESASFCRELLESKSETSMPQQEHDWEAVTVFEQTPAWIIRRSLSGETGFLLLVEAPDADAAWQTLLQKAKNNGGVEITPDAREVLRVEAGLPRYGQDYDFETLLPETGLERQAVNYSKGCYLGQETVARIKTYGMVQKALVGLLFSSDDHFPSPQSEIRLEGKPVGLITSVVKSPTLNRGIAMAYLGKGERIPGRILDLEIAGNHYAAEVILLPFYDAQIQKNGQALLAEGLKRFADGYDEEAIRLLNEAITRQPELVEAHEALGVILSRHERYPEAIARMERVLALQPEHVLAHTNLSVFYMKMGDKEKAEEEKAKATMAAFSQKAKASGLVFDIEAERRKKEQATLERIGMFQEALKFNPDDPLGNFGLGSAFLELKRYSEAVEPFQRVIHAQPKHSVAYLSLGKAWEGMSEPQQAADTYQKGIEVAAAKGDLMPLKEMQTRLAGLISESRTH